MWALGGGMSGWVPPWQIRTAIKEWPPCLATRLRGVCSALLSPPQASVEGMTAWQARKAIAPCVQRTPGLDWIVFVLSCSQTRRGYMQCRWRRWGGWREQIIISIVWLAKLCSFTGKHQHQQHQRQQLLARHLWAFYLCSHWFTQRFLSHKIAFFGGWAMVKDAGMIFFLMSAFSRQEMPKKIVHFSCGFTVECVGQQNFSFIQGFPSCVRNIVSTDQSAFFDCTIWKHLCVVPKITRASPRILCITAKLW